MEVLLTKSMQIFTIRTYILQKKITVASGQRAQLIFSISTVMGTVSYSKKSYTVDEYLLFTNWVQGPYEEIQAQGFSYSPSLRGLFGKPRACISWYGTSTQLVNSLLHDPF